MTAQLRVWCEGEGFTLLAETVNLSSRGLFVRTSSPPPPDRRFSVTLDELDVVAEVELRWTRARTAPGSSGLGLEIVEFVKGGEVFERYLERNSAKSGEHRLSWPPEGGDGQSPDPKRDE